MALAPYLSHSARMRLFFFTCCTIRLQMECISVSLGSGRRWCWAVNASIIFILSSSDMVLASYCWRRAITRLSSLWCQTIYRQMAYSFFSLVFGRRPCLAVNSCIASIFSSVVSVLGPYFWRMAITRGSSLPGSSISCHTRYISFSAGMGLRP